MLQLYKYDFKLQIIPSEKNTSLFCFGFTTPQKMWPNIRQRKGFFVQLWGAKKIHPQPLKKNSGRHLYKILPPSRLGKNKQKKNKQHHLGVEPKIMGKLPKSSFLMGFSIIFTIHFGYPYFWKHPFLVISNPQLHPQSLTARP